MKNNNYKISVLSILASALLIGCGGGGSSVNATSTSSTIGTGTYVDSAVEGLDYYCGTQSGKTDAQGTFSFETGQKCTFKIGELILREVSSTNLSDNVIILEDNTNVAQLLQSLDKDGDASNGITILPSAADTMNDNNIKNVPTGDIGIDDLVQDQRSRDNNYKGDFVSKEEANLHVAQTQANMNNGNQGNMNNANMNNSMNVTSTTLEDFKYVPYSKALAIPALASYSMIDGYKVFNLDIDEGTTEFFDGVQTNTYGINAAILGETIRIHRDDKVKLIYNNKLSVPTTMHGHGMHVPALMDGGPINKIQPNSSWTAQYTVNQKACTNWYHPHFMHKTAEHVYMGLAGFIIIDDDESDTLNLPKEYGVDDIPLALQDKRFDANGQIDYSPSTMEVRMGYKSDIMMVNGIINPYLDLPAKKVRLRVLNGTNARVYNLKFSDARSFTQVATDNAFLEHPVSMSSLVLTPGERAEIIVDFSNDMNKNILLLDSNSNLEIMKINVNKVATTSSDIAQNLTTLEKYDASSAVRTRKFILNMARGDDGAMHMAINGKLMDMMRIDEVVPKDEIEVWEITNNMGMWHNFHIHATHFFPIERNGSPDNILENEKGYKDTITMQPNSTVKVVVKMTDYVDDNTGYMYHCHFLEHEDDGMMGQFSVTNGVAVINVRP